MVENNYIGAVWFNKIGIVLMNNGYEDKAYIGEGKGEDEQDDIKVILRSGVPFPVNAAKLKIRGE